MPDTCTHYEASRIASALTDAEFNVQTKMWGADRPDYQKGELMSAAMTSLDLVAIKRAGLPSATAVKIANADFYPEDWSGFRDYGTDIANLVVAAAFLKSEITRLIAAGEDRTRAPRESHQTYAAETVPAFTSAEAIAEPYAVKSVDVSQVQPIDEAPNAES